jgi:hypothetical protein
MEKCLGLLSGLLKPGGTLAISESNILNPALKLKVAKSISSTYRSRDEMRKYRREDYYLYLKKAIDPDTKREVEVAR